MLTIESRSHDFPALATMAYLNTAAESIPPLCVGEALQEYWRDKLQKRACSNPKQDGPVDINYGGMGTRLCTTS